MSRKLYNRLGHIEIDEEDLKSLGSDYKQLKTKFDTAEQESQILERESKSLLHGAQLQEVSERIETTGETMDLRWFNKHF